MWAELGSRQGKAEPETQRAFIHKPGLCFSKGIVDKTAVLMLTFPVILLHFDNNTVSRSTVQHEHFCVSTPCLVFVTLNSNCISSFFSFFLFFLWFLSSKQMHAEGNQHTRQLSRCVKELIFHNGASIFFYDFSVFCTFSWHFIWYLW